ncbi:glycosyltransferase family 2 protein [Vibrio parahaemolyticus]|nr:glycosyltransferase family 2 protein [Vibrio parahaemolyticus]
MSISVIIPLYNKEYSIERAILSVLNQSLSPSELIIIDDGSTDNSLKVVNELLINNAHPLSSIITVVSQVNRGVSYTRNKGAKLSKYEYISFLDADDVWNENFLKNRFNVLVKNKNVGVCSGPHKVIKNNKSTLKKAIIINQNNIVKNFFISSLFGGSVLGSSKILIRKSLFNELGGFPTGIKVSEDIYFWIILSQNTKIYYLSSVDITAYVQEDNSRIMRVNETPYPLTYRWNISEKKISFRIFLLRLFFVHFMPLLRSKNRIGIKKIINDSKANFPNLMSFLSRIFR